MRRFVFVGLLLAAMGAFLTIAQTVSAKDACLCVCNDSTQLWTNLTAGQQTCVADCSIGRMCNGRDQLKDPETGGILIRTAVTCIPGSNDCSAPPYNIYKGVSCVLKDDPVWVQTHLADIYPKTPNIWSDIYPEIELKRTECVVPVTAENARLECASYGGIAKGGDCGKIEQGGDPNAYFKSRPDLGKIGTEFAGPYSNFALWESAVTKGHLNNEIHSDPRGHTDGICYRYGVLFGGLPTYDGFDPGPNGENVGPLGVVPTNKNVCLKAKRDTCGTDQAQPPSGQYGNLPARAYTCQNPASVNIPAGSSLDRVCFSVGNVACASKPTMRCCQGGAGTIGECLFDSECSSDRSMTCSNGKCVKNVVCDPLHNDPISNPNEPWRFDQRRCRDATSAETINLDYCSQELPTRRCPIAGQSCCRPVNPAVKSGCASDFIFEAGTNSIFNDFLCVDNNKIPTSGSNNQFALIDGQRSLVGFNDDWNEYNPADAAKDCLTSTQPKYDENGRVIGSQARCGSTSTCCNATRMDGAVKIDQKREDALCGPLGTTYTCERINFLIPSTNEQAETRGFSSREDVLQHLVLNGSCLVTPFQGGTIFSANQECITGLVCCKPHTPLWSEQYCQNDGSCDTQNGQTCNMEFHICELTRPDISSGESCLITAAGEGHSPVDIDRMRDAYPPETIFSCQSVNAASTDLDNKCLPVSTETSRWGCAPSTKQDKVTRCCIPGTGATASSDAQNKGVVPPGQAPFTLALPACIQTGDCTLPDIIKTGANFANFLLQIVGAVFLAIFVYGGLKYLTAVASGRAKAAREMLVTATKALALIFSAYVFIQFVQTSLIGGGDVAQSSACVESSTPERAMSCQYLQSAPDNADAMNKEISERGCVRKLCPGAANFLCCPS